MRSVTIFFLLSTGCAHESAQVTSPTTPQVAAPVSIPPSTSPALPERTIRRPELIAFLDQKPAAFLSQIRVEPELRNGRYTGWRILQLPADARFTDSAVHPGDVLTSINGRPVERPEQFFRVWEELRQADQLKFSLVRGGQPQTVTYQVVTDRAVEADKKTVVK